MRIALDAMGGDYAPHEVVKGAVEVLSDIDDDILLVGNEEIIKAELERLGAANEKRLVIKHASEVIKMDDIPSLALRKKRDSSIRVGLSLVKEGYAQAFVSAGNTGAVMVGAKLILGTLEGVTRPAIAVVLPSKKEPFVLIDAGANVDSKPEHLVEFAIMGYTYSKLIMGKDNPKIGLLSIGEEDLKGNGLTRNAFLMLKTIPQINFIGNVEGKELYDGKADVVVCDGFVGNLALKISESAEAFLSSCLKDVFSHNIFSKLAYLMVKPGLIRMKKKVDYRERGGAPLLGVRGICVISHGSSNSRAIANAIKVASQLAKERVNERIEVHLAAVKESIGSVKNIWRQIKGKIVQLKAEGERV